MARHSEKIKALTSRDKDVINMLRNTGACTSKQANRLNGITEARMNKLAKSGLVDKEGSKYGNVYSATTKGCQAVGGGATYHRAGLKHDLTLTREYLKIPESCRNSVRPGDTLRERTRTGSPDLVWTTEEHIEIAIEIITDNYGQEQIEAKEEFCLEHKLELQFIEAEEDF